MAQKAKTRTAAGKSAVGKARLKRPAAVRKLILEARIRIDEGFISLAKLLSEAYHKEFYLEWGFQDFGAYCDEELDIAYRKSMYFIEIWDKVKSLNLDQKKVASLGWSKMKDIATVINEKNAKAWLEKAAKMSSREVTEAVKVVRKKDTSGGVPTVTTMTLRMSESEASIVMEAVEEAKKLCESENAVVALEMICQDWLADKGVQPSRTTLESQISYLEGVYGVKLTAKKAAKKAETGKKKTAEGEGKSKKGSTKKGEAAAIDDLLDDGEGEDGKDAQDINEVLGI